MEIRFWNYGTRDRKVTKSWNDLYEFTYWVRHNPDNLKGRYTIRLPESKFVIDFKSHVTSEEVAKSIEQYVLGFAGKESLKKNEQNPSKILAKAMEVVLGGG